MVYYLSQLLINLYSGFNLFRYITVRSFLSFLTGFVISYLLFPPFIKFVKNKQFVQTIRDDGPKSHKVKANTPTMGGVIILISIIISTLLWARYNRFVIWSILSVIYLGILGFIDDYLKVIKKHSRGIQARRKLLFQTVFAISFCIYLYFYPSNQQYSMHLHIPYLKETFLYLGIFYYLFCILTFVGASNGVNLTDGLDGLAVGNIIFVSITYAIFSYVSGNFKIASYLKLPYVPGAGELTIVLSSLCGAGLGFLWYNSYPSEIFMGDTGSLFLGGLIGLITVIVKQELLLIISGGVFVIEALSVILQVGYYKRTKKRIFLMAPLHHHYELKGYAEPKITFRFWIVSIILSIIALSALKVR